MDRHLTRNVAETIGRGANALHELIHRSRERRFCIVPGYRHRQVASYFNDVSNTDEWQREVYLYARAVMDAKRLTRVYDVGCGSGFKLVHYLGKYEAIGFDLAPTVEFLKRKYPNRRWELCDFAVRHYASPDLVICSDVIEHVPNPDELVGFIKSMNPQFVIFSTPDRMLAYPQGSRYLLGPPENKSHYREWSFDEFAAYMSLSFEIIDHQISNREQATQLVFCAP